MKALKLVLLFGAILAGINSQIAGLGQANTCAKSALGDSLPTSKDTCFADKSDSNNNCCFVSASVQGINMNLCVSIPKGTDPSQVADVVKTFGASAKIECSSKMISLSILAMILMLLAL